MIDWLAPGLLYTLLKDVGRALGKCIGKNKRHLTPAKILQLRQKWKPLFEEKISKTHSQGLRKDVIVRDVKRLDGYPNTDESEKGISPWFCVGLVGTYHKGILVALRIGSLIKHGEGNGWRYPDHQKCEMGSLQVYLIGHIPFENIEAVDWQGDEYYGFPHIYCYFDSKRKEPYEELIFCEERCNPGGRPFYTEVASYDSVRKLSKKLKIRPSF